MNAPRVVTIGGATQDVFVISKDVNIMRMQSFDCEDAFFAIPYGAKVDVDEMFITTGGSATNTSITFHRFGLATSVLAKVGDDRSGGIVRERLVEEGIDDSMIAVDPDHRTGYSAILVGYTGERSVLVHRGATLHLTESDIDWDRMREAELVFVGSLSGQVAELYPTIAQFCAENGIFFASNPGSGQFCEGVEACRPFLAHVDMLFMNQDEAYQFTGVEPKRGPHDEREMLERLRAAGAMRVIITQGAKGCQAIDDDAYYSIPAAKAEVVSTLGAGDAFAAGCTAAFFKGEPFARALRFGAINAAGVVSKIGAKRGIRSWAKAADEVTEWERDASDR